MRKKISHFLGISALALSLFVSVPANAQELEVTDVQLTEQTEDIPMATNGWVTNSDGTFSYYEDGEKVTSCVKLIGSKYYGFDYDGIMFSDTSFYMNGEYYRAKKNGDLYQNTWYNDGNYYYYYFSDATAASDELMITSSGTKYYFNYWGELQTNCAFTYDGVNYVADANGVCTILKDNTWVKVGDYYFYSLNGKLCREQIALINGKYYGFDYDGRMCVNKVFYAYNYDDYTYNYYAADANGVLRKSTWVQYNGYWYYIGSDYRAYEDGFYTIGGKSYYFNSWAEMIVNSFYNIDGETYVFDANGSYKKLVNNSWNLFNGKYCYMKDGVILRGCVELIDGKYYGFGYDNYMYTATAFEFYNSDLGEWINYRAKSDGTLYRNEWYKDKNGNYQYFGSDCISYKNGVYTIGGKKYAFNSIGNMITESFYIFDGKNYICDSNGIATEIKNNAWTLIDGNYYYVLNGTLQRACVTLIGGNYYGFDSDGKMYDDQAFFINDDYYRAKSGGVLYKSQWYMDAWGDYFYYGSDAKAYSNGVYTIGSKKYAFSYRQLLCNNIIQDSTGCYVTDANGVATKLSSGWKQVKVYDRQRWVYVKNNQFLEGKQNISGVEYFFSGYLLYEYDGYVYFDDEYYLVKKDGKLVTQKGWHKSSGNWFYVNSDYTLYDGILKLNGKLYYLQPGLLTNDEFVMIQGEPYSVKNNDGVLTKITANGIYTDYGSKYYVQNGKIFTGWKLLNGSWYYFNSDMAINEVVEDNEKLYYFDDQGKMLKNCWINYNSRYATASGALAVGETVINGKTYYFDEYGINKEGYINNEKPYVYYDGAGNYKTMNFKDGWNKYNGYWYYKHDVNIYHNISIIIDGKRYCFDNDGKMITNQMVNDIYYGSDGVARTGWVQFEGEWYYYDESANMITGLTEIDGNKYYFAESDGSMCTTEAVIDGQKYTFYSDGRVKSIGSFSTGWYSINNEASYYKNGELYTGWLGNSYIEVGKKKYATIIYDYSQIIIDGYYIDENGNYVKNKYIESENVYAKADGKLASDEWIKINGSWYYFGCEYQYYYGSEFYARNGVQIIDGVTYIFEDYKMIKQFSTIKDGWQKVGSYWYYAINGKFVVEGIKYIDGSWYQFSEGRMLADTINELYMDENGKASRTSGWKKLWTQWFYFNADGTVHEGWLTIGSNTYYCSYGYMLTGYQIIGGTLYYFDANGVLKGERGVTNGWYKAGGNWYYFIDSKPLLDETLSVDGATYGFDMYGHMITGRAAYVDYNTKYYFGADGKRVTKQGTYTDAEGETVYVGADGRAHTGHLIINGVHKYMTAKAIYAY